MRSGSVALGAPTPSKTPRSAFSIPSETLSLAKRAPLPVLKPSRGRSGFFSIMKPIIHRAKNLLSPSRVRISLVKNKFARRRRVFLPSR